MESTFLNIYTAKGTIHVSRKSITNGGYCDTYTVGF